MAEMISTLYEKYLASDGVSTDTRKIAPDSIFFALKGPNFDANKFAQEAIEKGAKYAVVDDEKYVMSDQYILVDDTLKSLQALATHHRSQLKIPVIGITGSNGKTTTKELMNAVLSKKFKTLATIGNLNNHIGVPLTILSITDKIEIAIIEMGASKGGDIEELCHIALPTHGLITNIGQAHTEGFGGIEGVIKGKNELYRYLSETGGKVFANSTNEILMDLVKVFDKPYFYPQSSDYYNCELVESEPFLVIKAGNGKLIETNLIGTYNFENVAAALCVGKFFEVKYKKANKAISNYSSTNNRSQILKKGSNTIISDAYNANPVSMMAAIDNCKSMKAENKVLILGDMNELGDSSVVAHENIGNYTSGAQFTQVIFVGKKMKDAHNENPTSIYFEKPELLKEFLSQSPIEDALILIKASRSLGLEQVIEYL